MKAKLRGYCYSCRSGAGPNHGSTAKHRDATRAPEYHAGAGAWLKPTWSWLYRDPDDDVTPEENAAAAARLGIEWPMA